MFAFVRQAFSRRNVWYAIVSRFPDAYLLLERPTVLPRSEALLTFPRAECFNSAGTVFARAQPPSTSLELPTAPTSPPLSLFLPTTTNPHSLSTFSRHNLNKPSPSTTTSSHTNMPPKAVPGAPTLSTREMELLQNYMRCVKTKPEVRHPTQTQMPVEQ
jgi:hypothetical protein